MALANYILFTAIVVMAAAFYWIPWGGLAVFIGAFSYVLAAPFAGLCCFLIELIPRHWPWVARRGSPSL